ncbi:MAG: FxsA cytoplasmic rane protein [Blastococcus sp.]|nr:FxsA cytoplasmic rane protein [Blastococcus sp.]
MRDAVGRRVRVAAGLLILAELAVFVLVVNWIGVGLTILATLTTSALGFALLGRQGTKALAELRDRARSRRPAGRELGDAGLVAAGGLLMVLPGFLGDVVGLLCLLPVTRGLVRGVLTRLVLTRLPDRMRGPVRVESVRTAGVGSRVPDDAPLVIEGEIVRGPDGRPLT